MKRNAMIALLSVATVFGVAGCGSEEKPKKEVKQEETKKEKDSTASSQKGEAQRVEKEYVFAKYPMQIEKQEEVLYKSDNGAVRYLGYTIDEPTGKTLVALQYEGDMAALNEDDMTINVIADDSMSNKFSKANQIETRVTDKGEIRIYQMNKDFKGKKPIRMDVVYAEKINGDSDEKDRKTFQLKPPSGTTSVPGVEAIEKLSHTGLSMKKEGKDMDVEVNSIVLSNDYKEVRIEGMLNLKKDLKDTPASSFYHPVTGQIGRGKVSISTETSSLFAGTKIPFVSTMSLKEVVGNKDGVINFSIEDTLYAFDLATGKELNEVSLTGFPSVEASFSNQKPSIYGFKDVSGKTHYDAMKWVGSTFNFGGSGAIELGEFQYPISGDFKTLTFDLGAGADESVNTGEYTVRLYGDDYKVDIPNKQILGKPLFEKKINKNSPMEPVTINVEGVKKLTIFYDTHIKGDMFADKNIYIPMIISDMKLKK